MTFKLGDCVQQVGYAIPMVVETIEGNQITCSWRDGKGTMKRDTFPVTSLKPFQGRRAIRVRF
jgi:uncharacterized protein YodC (DUF2158 family)